MSVGQTNKSWLSECKADLKYIYTKLNLFFTPTLIDTDKGQRFAGPGCLGFKGGVFNPGALLCDTELFVVAKGQQAHWKVAFAEDFAKGNPLLFRLNANLDVQHTHKITVIDNLPEINPKQIEDFRMFKFRDTIYSNHAVLCLKKDGGYDQCVQMLSTLDATNKTLTFVGQPLLDFKVNNKEKNWVFFEHKDELYLLYSFSPYILLKAMQWPELEFKTVINKENKPAFHRPPILHKEYIGFSTNPVSYDENNFLVVIHSSTHVLRYGRLYFHWAVLIDKQSLLPVKISSRPLIKGGKCKGMLPGVIYTMAVILSGDYLVLFNGEGDAYCSYVKMERKALDASFVDFKQRRKSFK